MVCPGSLFFGVREPNSAASELSDGQPILVNYFLLETKGNGQGPVYSLGNPRRENVSEAHQM